MNRYKNARLGVTEENKKRYYTTTKYPEIPLSENDIYVYSTQGDRFDVLAQRYYLNSSYWWIISIANRELPQSSYYIPEGTQIRIPQNIDRVISKFNTLNGRD